MPPGEILWHLVPILFKLGMLSWQWEKQLSQQPQFQNFHVIRLVKVNRANTYFKVQDIKNILFSLSFSFSSAPSSFHPDIYEHASYWKSDNDEASSPPMSAAGEQYVITTSLFVPSIPWDLVQHWPTPDLLQFTKSQCKCVEKII